MKASYPLFFCCFLALSFLQSGGEEIPPSWKESRFEMRLSGGMSDLSPGDLNAVLDGMNSYLKDRSDVLGWPMEGGFQTLRMGLEVEAEGILYLSRRLGLSFGAGYIHGNKAAAANAIKVTAPSRDEIFTEGMAVKAIPVKLGAVAFFPLSSRIRASFSGQAIYFFTEVSCDYRYEWGSSWYASAIKASGKGFGVQAGLGVEYRLSRSLGVFLEGQGRYGKIKGLDGSGEESQSDGWSRRTDGRLYHFEVVKYPGPGNWYPDMFIYSEKPDYGSMRNVREANISLSAMIVRAGITMKF